MRLFRRKTPRAITTDQVRRVQFEHHVAVQDKVKRIIPTSSLCESAAVYASIGQYETYDVIRTYIQLIALNEAEGSDWNFVVDEVFRDSRLRATDREAHFIPNVLELQRRAMFEPLTLYEAEAEFAELEKWKVVE